jgi:hypothetical protein
MLASASFFALVALFTVSIVVGVIRRRAGVQLSSEIEQAAGMEDRWRPRSRARSGGKGDHAAA